MKNKYRSLLFPLAAAALSLPAADALAQPVTASYCDGPDFNSPTIQYNCNSSFDASFNSGSMRLTALGVPNQQGAAFFKDHLDFTANGASLPVSTYFRFLVGKDGDVNPGGNGLTFILQNDTDGAGQCGENGNGMGFAGISPSIVFEFDTHQDALEGPHVSLMMDGDAATHHASATIPASVGNIFGQELDVWIDYDAAGKSFAVYMAKAKDPPAKPAVALAWSPEPGGVYDPTALNLGTHLAGQGYLGFTSSTGSVLTNDHRILKWEFSTGGIPCDCAGATDAERNAYCDLIAPNRPICNPVDPDVPTGPKICGCVVDGQCPAYEAAKCDAFPGSQACVPCTTDANCEHFGDPKHALCLIDDTHDGVCGECKTDADCPMDRPNCDNTLPVPQCTGGCTKDDECIDRDKARCDKAAMPEPTCDKCISDVNCAHFASTDNPTTICGSAGGNHPGRCLICNMNSDCKDSAKPVCLLDEQYNECVECVTNDDCKDPLEPICDPTAHTCGPQSGRVIAGGGCSLSHDATKDALSALGIAVAGAALALARRRRRS